MNGGRSEHNFYFPSIGRSVYRHDQSRVLNYPAGIMRDFLLSQTERDRGNDENDIVGGDDIGDGDYGVVFVNGLAELSIYSLSSADNRHFGPHLHNAGSQMMELITKRKLLAELKVLTRLADILAIVSMSDSLDYRQALSPFRAGQIRGMAVRPLFYLKEKDETHKSLYHKD